MAQTKEQLEKRHDEILAELDKVNEEQQIELYNDPEEQAIQLEQDEVAVIREQNLRKELIDVENKLAEIEKNEQ